MSFTKYFIGAEAILREFERQRNEESDGDIDVDADSVYSEDEDAVLRNDDNQLDEFEVQEGEHEEEGFVDEVDRTFTLGKDLQTIWTNKPLLEHRRYRTPSKNIITHLPGAKGRAKDAIAEVDFFSLFVDDEIINIIVQGTNEEIMRTSQNFRSPQRFIGPTESAEVRALIGMLIMAGVLKDSNLSLFDLFSDTFGIPFFCATMPKVRFEFLLCNFRFDSKNTRIERRAVDVFAPFRDMWEKFVINCRSNYTPSEYVTIDETLLSFRGRCPFKMYIPNKPDKYGLKIVSMCDARTFYFCDGIPYVGKTTLTENSQLGKPTQYVMKLSNQIANTNRNITMDNWFTSYELAEKLTEKKLTLVGTLRKNKKEIPPSFVSVRGVPLKSSRFLYQPDKMMVSFNQARNKNVIVMSTMHDTEEVNAETRKSEVEEFYNLTKGGVDVFDKLCHTYTTKRANRRWPMRYFFGLLDTAAVNAYILFSLKPNETKRSTFLKSLAFSLTEPFMRRRLSITNLPKKLRSKISTILGVEEDNEPTTSAVKRLGKRGRCAYCPIKKDRKSQYSCDRCAKYLCLEHAAFLCKKCLETGQNRNNDDS